MLEIRNRIEKRTEDLRLLLSGLEKKRDELLDQLAFKKGEASLIEEIIKTVYDQIRKASEEEQSKFQQESFTQESRGIKTPRKNTSRKNVSKN